MGPRDDPPGHSHLSQLEGLPSSRPRKQESTGTHVCGHAHTRTPLGPPAGTGEFFPRTHHPHRPCFQHWTTGGWRDGATAASSPPPHHPKGHGSQDCAPWRGGDEALRALAPRVRTGRGTRAEPTLRLLQLLQPPPRGLQGQVQLVAGAEQPQQVAGAGGATRVVNQLPGGGQPVRPDLEPPSLDEAAKTRFYGAARRSCIPPVSHTPSPRPWQRPWLLFASLTPRAGCLHRSQQACRPQRETPPCDKERARAPRVLVGGGPSAPQMSRRASTCRAPGVETPPCRDLWTPTRNASFPMRAQGKS